MFFKKFREYRELNARRATMDGDFKALSDALDEKTHTPLTEEEAARIAHLSSALGSSARAWAVMVYRNPSEKDAATFSKLFGLAIDVAEKGCVDDAFNLASQVRYNCPTERAAKPMRDFFANVLPFVKSRPDFKHLERAFSWFDNAGMKEGMPLVVATALSDFPAYVKESWAARVEDDYNKAGAFQRNNGFVACIIKNISSLPEQARQGRMDQMALSVAAGLNILIPEELPTCRGLNVVFDVLHAPRPPSEKAREKLVVAAYNLMKKALWKIEGNPVLFLAQACLALAQALPEGHPARGDLEDRSLTLVPNLIQANFRETALEIFAHHAHKAGGTLEDVVGLTWKDEGLAGDAPQKDWKIHSVIKTADGKIDLTTFTAASVPCGRCEAATDLFCAENIDKEFPISGLPTRSARFLKRCESTALFYPAARARFVEIAARVRFAETAAAHPAP